MKAKGVLVYRTLKMPVLNMVGDHSPHIDATVNFNGRLDPAKYVVFLYSVADEMHLTVGKM